MRNMGLMQMSIHGSVLVLVILMVRLLWLDKLPKRTFPMLWDIALLRLLMPFSVSFAYSFYSFLGAGQLQISGGSEAIAADGRISADTLPAWSTSEYPVLEVFEQHNLSFPAQNNTWVLALIWSTGCFLCAAVFAVTYLRSLRCFREAVPVEDMQVRQWLLHQKSRRCISVRQTDRIAAPLTYGILYPVILLPGKALWKDSRELTYVLQHEYVHICRYDAVRKLLAAAALCIHWFNPFVWIMIGMLNRDIELACDEDVLRRFGSQSKVGYAMALIGMEEKKRSFLPIFNGFSKNAIEERINLIMKYKKTKYMAVAASALLVLSITLGFATTSENTQAGEARLPVSTGNEASVQVSAIDRDGTDAGTGTGLSKDQENGISDPANPVNDVPAEYQMQTDTVSNIPINESLSGVNPDNSRIDANSAADSYVISYMAEGLPQEVPADLYIGSNYGILIPKEGWRMYAPDAWLWESNELVQFWVADYGENTPEQVTEMLMAEGYNQTQDAALLQKESENRLFFVRIHQNDERIMTVIYTYPADPEYMEGFGNILDAIAMNFTLLPSTDSTGLSEDADQAKQLALHFWEAWLAADEAGMKACLSEKYNGSIEGFPKEEPGYDAGEASLQKVKGLDFQQIAAGDSCTVWIEFLPSADADSLVYLTLELVKETEGLKIYAYGLEM